MNDASVELQALIERIRRGDREARRDLLAHACDRLRRLTARVFNESFPALRNRHELDSVVHETWLRLVQALEKTEPPTVADFFRLAAHKVRQVLLDMAARQRRLASREALGFSDVTHPAMGAAQQTYDPGRLAQWTEFHEKVEALTEDERAVFEMHYYLELPQAQVAELLEMHPRKVSRLWIAATERLAEGLTAGDEPV
ncbi:MAG TPA: sigma-70 family RNA polymerase sigma factor [Gemmataceae bacterium]|nr:sigma-70 family RNA polymerase sigma factor [Gemmataceae bacterium]